ncbi:sensor domain-containing protein [Chitinolyticbacter albus]|uniref:sensor domain-containing protein n=1 Tax=Chitinolyticbacter albus TaxID=2961951 RepID=UPI00210F0D92|nr:diguanylate cyclase [Chitinolyticbacter albus]
MIYPTISMLAQSIEDLGAHANIRVHPRQIWLWSCDAEGMFDFFSPSWLAFTGSELAAELGQGWLGRVLPEDRALLWGDILDALQRAIPWQRQFRLKRHDGAYHPVLMSGVVHHGADGRFAGFTGYCIDITQDEKGDPAASLPDSQLISLLEQTRLLAMVIDCNGIISFSNAQLRDVLGQPEEALRHTSFFDHFQADHPDLQPEQLASNGGQIRQIPVEFEATTSAGQTPHRILWHAMAQRDYADTLTGAVLIGEDITTRQIEEDKLILAAKVFESSRLAMAIADEKGRILSVNDAFTRLTGYSEAEVQGQNPRILQSGRHTPEFYKEMWAILNATDHWHGDIWDRRKDGTIYPKSLSINAVRDEQGRITHYSSIFSDITERKQIEEKLSRLAHHDALTKLPNRILLRQQLGKAILSADDDGARVAVLYIDLDRFKQVNDSLGHAAGDQVLLEVTRRMKGCVRVSDMVARVGGDEFIVLLPSVVDADAVGRIADKIVEVLKQPIALGQYEAVCTPSIGISLFPDHARDIDALIHDADQAMYQIKTTTRCGYHFHALEDED